MNTRAATRSGSLHQRLRASTDGLHRAAEAAFDPGQALSSIEGYVDLLDRLWSLHAGAERALGVHGPDLFGLNLDERRRSPLLAQDLDATAARAPHFAPVSLTYASPAAALGGLYVLEGSTLGGRVLVRRAQDTLGFTGLNGARFLEGHGSDTGRLWRVFLQALGRIPALGEDAEQVEAGACATFALFVDRLGRDPGANSPGIQPQTVALSDVSS